MVRILLLHWLLLLLCVSGTADEDQVLALVSASLGESEATKFGSTSVGDKDVSRTMQLKTTDNDITVSQVSSNTESDQLGTSFRILEPLDLQIMFEADIELDNDIMCSRCMSRRKEAEVLDSSSVIKASPITNTKNSDVASTTQDSVQDSSMDLGLNVPDVSSSKTVQSSEEQKTASKDDIKQLHVHEAPVKDDASSNITNLLANETLGDGVHFMSFEEWKKQKQAELSLQQQLLQQLQQQQQLQQLQHHQQQQQDQQNQQQQQSQYPKQEVKLNNSTNCANGSTANCIPDIKNSGNKEHESDISDKKAAKVELSDDSNPKTYKKLNNYASADCAATIIQTNRDAKGASSILKENKDTYMLNKCSTVNKFVIIELCQDILVNSIEIGNFEFFSSMFRNFRVSVSAEFPSLEWQVLGEFEASNKRVIQEFIIANPLIWAKYLKLEILSHYGNEFYCPISVLRVHGKTMMDDFKENTAEVKVENLEEIKVPEVNIDNLAAITTAPPQLSEECRVVLPHLRINEFLKDLNSTAFDMCYVQDTPIEASSSSSSSVAATPEAVKATQESVYQTIMKRLSLLESNATLSLLYIEEQSKLLSSAFSKLETRQGKRFQALLDSFNSTMTDQFLNFKQAYHNLEHKYFDQYKEKDVRTQLLLQEAYTNIKALSAELRFQRIISILNIVFVICLLVYVIVTRDVVTIENNTSNSDTSDNATNQGLLRAPFITRLPFTSGQSRMKSAFNKQAKSRRNQSSKKHKF